MKLRNKNSIAIAVIVLIVASYGLYKDKSVDRSTETNYQTREVMLGADSGATSAGTGANVVNSCGEVSSWANPGNITASDNVYASASFADANLSDEFVYLIKGGSRSGNNKATATALPTSEQYVSYGGVSDLWGNTLSVSDVNATNFGFSYAVGDGEFCTDDLQATNFGFSIPAGSTIDGVVAEIEVFQFPGDPQADHVRMTVYYTEGGGGGGGGGGEPDTRSKPVPILFD